MKYNPGQQRVEAIYSKVQNPLHQGNPLIEALPEIKGKETLAAGLRMEIPFSEEQLQYPPEVRADLVGALNHYFAPWELHLALAQEIRSAICDGYVNRNLLEKAFQESIRQVRAAVQEKDAEFHSCTFSRNNPISSSFSIIGYSGMGKSSSVRNILAQIPQVIRHGTYRGEPFAETQVVLPLSAKARIHTIPKTAAVLHWNTAAVFRFVCKIRCHCIRRGLGITWRLQNEGGIFMPFCHVPPSRAIRDRAHIWNYYLPPFHMAPHVYQVGGNNDVCVYLLDSGDGLILLDTGLQETLYLVVDSIHRMGFDRGTSGRS